MCNSKADKMSFVYHTHETKRRKEQNEKKNRLAIKSGNSKKKHPRDVCGKARETTVGRFMEKAFTFESGVEQR